MEDLKKQYEQQYEKTMKLAKNIDKLTNDMFVLKIILEVFEKGMGVKEIQNIINVKLGLHEQYVKDIEEAKKDLQSLGVKFAQKTNVQNKILS